MNKNMKLIFSGLIVLVGVVVLLMAAAPEATATELNLEDLVTNPEKTEGEYITVQGYVDEESIQWDGEKIQLDFTVNDKKGNEMNVTYNGTKPDNFTEDVIAILQGEMGEDGTFKAEKIQTKCPSKYEGQDPKNDPNLDQHELDEVPSK